VQDWSREASDLESATSAGVLDANIRGPSPRGYGIARRPGPRRLTARATEKQAAATNLRTLAATIKARWICEQAHQQLKEELGSTTSKRDPGKDFTAMRS
jgi:hypothetical protein